MTDKKLRELGVADAVVRKAVLDALEEESGAESGLQAEYDKAMSELENVKKQAAVERAILEAGGKHVKAILALIDMDQVTYDEKRGLKGLDMEEIREEAPYLFHEKEEQKKGTGVTKSSLKKKEDDIRAAFWGLK
ncbi:phage scaffolding protein [Anaerotignum sp.]